MRGRSNPVETLAEVQRAGHGLVAICRYSGCRHRKEVDLDRLVQRVGGPVLVLPDRSQPHFTDRMRCPACKRPGVNLWLMPAIAERQPLARAVAAKEPNYRIIDHGRHEPYQFEMIATADNLFVAKAAYGAAAHFYAGNWFTLMQGAFVIDDNKRDGQPEIMPEEHYRRMRAMESGAPLSDFLSPEEIAALGKAAG